MYFTILFKCWLSIAGEYDRTTFLFELALLSRGVIAAQKKEHHASSKAHDKSDALVWHQSRTNKNAIKKGVNTWVS